MSDPSQRIDCDVHGAGHATFVCRHLLASGGLGFVAPADDADDPRPDAWCGVCESRRAAAGGWTEELEEAAGVTVICHACYDLARRRHAERQVIPAPAPFRCASCSQLHHEELLDLAFERPHTCADWPDEVAARAEFTDDTVTLDDERFVRACLELPLTDAPSVFVWGVWGTLSEASFATYQEVSGTDAALDVPPLFSWFCSRIPTFPDTYLLKARLHLRPNGLRPYVELEPTDHPLAVAQREGVTLATARTWVTAGT